MAQQLPYLSSYKNVEKLFQKIQTAKQPDAFTHKFLVDTLGLKSTSDRSLIPLLRNLGFIDGSNRPTASYGALKNPTTAKAALARGIRAAYEALFAADENAHALSSDQLRGLVSQVAGADSGMTQKISGTFGALVKQADFSGGLPDAPAGGEEKADKDETKEGARAGGGGLRADFHYNIQIHLPANGSEETYLNIFNSLRSVFR